MGLPEPTLYPGETVPVLVRALVTSDEREFHTYAEGIGNLLIAHAK